MKQEGIFNHEAHAEEIQLLQDGKFKQLHVFGVDLTNQGLVKDIGGEQGVLEMEGCGLVCLNTWIRPGDYTLFQSSLSNPVYVRFNHTDNPFLPIGLPATSGQSQPFPSSYALTIGKMWFYVQTPVNGQTLYLALVKGVSIEAGAGSVAGVVATYVSPTIAGSPGGYWNVGNPQGKNFGH